MKPQTNPPCLLGTRAANLFPRRAFEPQSPNHTESAHAPGARLGVTIQPPLNVHRPGFKELIRIIWSLIKPNKVLNLGGVGVHWGGVHV